MAGSLRTFSYVADNGDDFLYLADESNTEAIHDPVPNPPTGSSVTRFGIPRNVRPRAAYYASRTTTRRLRIIVATIAQYNDLPDSITDPIEGTGLLYLTGVTGEKLRLYPRGVDTGLTDGDNP